MKRALDLFLLAISAPFTIPIGGAVALLLRILDGPPILFTQMRIGRGGKPFVVYKFRTMSNRTGADGRLLPDATRLTPVGRILRKTSLDELPQLWNVARGDMSFVGPRPLLVEYLPYYTPYESQRHLVRPGITGLAQVLGRNNLSWVARLRADVAYVQSRSLWLDLRILAKTVAKTLRRSDVSVVAGDTGDPLHIERSYPKEGEYALRRFYRRDIPSRVQAFNSPEALKHMQLGRIDEEGTLSWHLAASQDPSRHDFTLVNSDDEPCAFTGLKKISANEAEFYLVVHPSWRGKGLGRLATLLTERWAEQSGFCAKVTLTVSDQNSAARAIYARLGWKMGEVKNGRITMSKPV